jgi:hypothetical protein
VARRARGTAVRPSASFHCGAPPRAGLEARRMQEADELHDNDNREQISGILDDDGRGRSSPGVVASTTCLDDLDLLLSRWRRVSVVARLGKRVEAGGELLARPSSRRPWSCASSLLRSLLRCVTRFVVLCGEGSKVQVWRRDPLARISLRWRTRGDKKRGGAGPRGCGRTTTAHGVTQRRRGRGPRRSGV